MKRIVTMLFVLIFVGASCAADVEIVGAKPARPGRLVKLTAKSANPVTWFTVDDCDLLPFGNDAVFSGVLPTGIRSKEFRVYAYSAKLVDGKPVPTEIASAIIVVETDEPAPPKPMPNPPGPVADDWQRTYDADRSADKAAQLRALRNVLGLFREEVRTLDVKTTGELNAKLKDMSKRYLEPGFLRPVRDELARIFETCFGTCETCPLTEAQRKAGIEAVDTGLRRLSSIRE